MDFIQSLHKKHTAQLAKINLKPSDRWMVYMRLSESLLPKINRFIEVNQEIEMTPLRKTFMEEWGSPGDPTMVGEFDVNVSQIEYFKNTYPPETLTILMTQAISYFVSETASSRHFLSYNKLYESKEAYTGLVVKLPGCGDHLGTIVFENAHLMHWKTLSYRIAKIRKMMVLCFKQREMLENKYPYLKAKKSQLLYEFMNSDYAHPFPGSPIVSVSNIAPQGYSRAKSPLRIHESMKFTILSVQRKPVWNDLRNAFEPQDLVAMSISADHRICDGNTPVPETVRAGYEKALANMLSNASSPKMSTRMRTMIHNNILDTFLGRLAEANVEAAYQLLWILQTYWMDYIGVEDLFKSGFSTQ